VSQPLTFVAVHAHPDDEASSTGGTLRLLKNQGVRTVLVTCTNGEFGDAQGGVKPDQPGHDPDAVAHFRKHELDHACEILGVDRLVRLGYRDSGMMGWPQNDDPNSFWSTPVEVAAARLVEVLNEERPQVVMTYNEIGFYGHPDHIQAHRITLAALRQLDYQPTLYFNAIPATEFQKWRERFREEALRESANAEDEAQARAGAEAEEEEMDLGTPDEQVNAVIDVRSVIDAKYDALAAHASQLSDSFWMRMGREGFREVGGTEWYVRVQSPFTDEGVVTDLFASYR